MKHFQPVLALLCAIVLLVGVLSACGGGGKKPVVTESGENTAAGSSAGTAEPDAFDYESGDRLDKSLDYGNDPFKIITWNTQLISDWIPEYSDNLSAVDEAIYKHLVNVEDRLNLDISIQEIAGRYAQMESFIETLDSYKMAGLMPDLVCQYSLSASIGMLRGLYDDLLQPNHIDYDAPWWNKSLVEGNTVHESLYYITGDMTPTITYNMYLMMFNKELIERYHLESPYTMVDEGNWTLGRFMELIKDTALNPNASGTYNSADNVMYGLDVRKLSVDAFQTGFGISAVAKQNTNDNWTLSKDYTGTRMTDIVDTVRAMVFNNPDVFYDKDGTYDLVPFTDNHAIFLTATPYDVERAIRDHGMEVGVAPIPKYDAQQEGYGTRLGVTVSLFSVPAGLGDDYARSTAVVEALAIDGYRNLTPVVFEKTFCTRYANRPEDTEMFLLVRDSIVYDPGNFYNALSSFSALRNCVYNDSSWQTYLDSKLMARHVPALADINKMGT